MTKQEREFVKTLTKGQKNELAEVRKFVNAVGNSEYTQQVNDAEAEVLTHWLKARLLTLSQVLGVTEDFVARLISN